jgi:hypothetical protein
MTDVAQTFTLHIMLMGFFILVPQSDSVTVLIPDLKDITFASDGTPIPTHRALLAYSCADLPNHACTTDDRTQPALDDFSMLYPEDPSANGQGVRQLTRLQLSVNGSLQAAPVPTLPKEILSLKYADPSFSDQVDKALIAPTIPVASRDMLAGRATFKNLLLKSTSNIKMTPNFDTIFSFTPLKAVSPGNDPRGKLSEQVDLYMTVQGCTVELQLDDFDGKNIAKIQLNAPTCQNPSERVDVALYNQSKCSPNFLGQCLEALKGNHYGIHHFEDYYDYSSQPPPIRHRRVPKPFDCGPGNCPPLDGVSRPICPMVQMNP